MRRSNRRLVYRDTWSRVSDDVIPCATGSASALHGRVIARAKHLHSQWHTAGSIADLACALTSAQSPWLVWLQFPWLALRPFASPAWPRFPSLA